MRDGQATRRRILEAATAEFAAFGIAGARVDRIAASAKANKAQMYAYFGDKNSLFDAVLEANVDDLINAVPFTADDLPGYAVGVYDSCLAHPELVRLATWLRLERVSSGELVSVPEETARELHDIEMAQRSGLLVSSVTPADLLALATTMALTWSAASLFYVATQDEPESQHRRRRQALAESVRRAFVVG